MSADQASNLELYLSQLKEELESKHYEYTESLQALSTLVAQEGGNAGNATPAISGQGLQERDSADALGYPADGDGAQAVSPGRGRGLLELLNTLGGAYWQNQHVCVATPQQTQEWMQMLVRLAKNCKEDHQQLCQMARDLLMLRDSAGWKVKPALAATSRAEVLGMQTPTRNPSALVRRESVGSADSFFDTDDEQIYKTWKEVCELLDVGLQHQMSLITGCPAELQQQLLSHCITSYDVIATAELVWHRWSQIRTAELAELPVAGVAAAGGDDDSAIGGNHGDVTSTNQTRTAVQQQITALSTKVCHLMKTMHLDVITATLLATKPPLDLILQLVGRTIESGVSSILTLMSECIAARPGVPELSPADDVANNDSNAPTSLASANRVSMFSSSANPSATSESLAIGNGGFKMFCDVVGEIETLASTLHTSLADRGFQVGMGDGTPTGRDGRKPASPRPNIQHTLYNQFNRKGGRTSGHMTLVEEEDNESEHLSDGGGLLDGRTGGGTDGVGRATLRHSRERWKWSTDLEAHGPMLASMMRQAIRESAEVWTAAEADHLQKFTATELGFRKDYSLVAGCQCCSEAAVAFFADCSRYFQLASFQLASSHSSWQPKLAFADSVDAAIANILNTIETALGNDDLLSLALFYYLSVVCFCRSVVLGYDAKLGAKQNTFRHGFLATKSGTGGLRAKLLDRIVTKETEKLMMGSYDDDSQNWDNQKSYFKSEACSYPVRFFIISVKALLFKLECCGLCCHDDGQLIVASVLSSALRQYAARYSSTKPTERRIPLFRSDIALLLETVYDVIWKLIPQRLITAQSHDPGQCCENLVTHLLSIQQSCATLYVVMATVTSPVSVVSQALQSSLFGSEAASRPATSQQSAGLSTAYTTLSAKLQWMLDLHDNGHSVARCVETATWSWGIALAAMATHPFSHNVNWLLHALQVQGSRLARGLVASVAHYVRQQYRRSSQRATQTDMFAHIVWPLHCILHSAGNDMLLSRIFEVEQESIEKLFYLSKNEECLDCHSPQLKTPFWLRCVYEEISNRMLTGLPALLLDLKVKLSPRKPVVPSLACGCTAPSEQGLSVRKAAQIIVRDMLADMRTTPTVMSVLHMAYGQLSKLDAPAVDFLSLMARLVTLMINSVYVKCQSQGQWLPGDSVRQELINAVWSALGRQTSAPGKRRPAALAPAQLTLPWTPSQSAANKTMQHAIVHIAPSRNSAPSAMLCIATDDWKEEISNRYGSVDCVEQLQRLLIGVEAKYISAMLSTSTPGQAAMTDNEAIVADQMTAAAVMSNGELTASKAAFSPLKATVDVNCFVPGQFNGSDWSWEEHMSRAVQMAEQRFLVELVKSRFEVWDNESSVAPEDASSVERLRGFLAAVE